MFTKIKNFLFGSKEAEVVGVPYKVEPPKQEEIKTVDSAVSITEATPAEVPVAPPAEAAAPAKTTRKKAPAKKETGSMSGAAKKKAPAKKPAETKAAPKSKTTATKSKKSKPVIL